MTHIEQLEQVLSDEEQRLNKLYSIVNKQEKRVTFKLNKDQQAIYDLIKAGKKRIIVLKSRQKGFSSLFGRIALDRFVWQKDFTAKMIFDTNETAKAFFQKHIKTTYDEYINEFPALEKYSSLKNDTQNGMVNVNNSSIDCTTRARSGTINYLHVSEFALISEQDPAKAREIVTGGLPAVTQDGIIIIETTSRGKVGEFWRLCELALDNMANNRLEDDDWYLYFTGWTNDETCQSEKGQVLPNIENYAKEIKEKHNIDLTDSQKRFYSRKWQELRDDIKCEFPTVLEECFEISNQGAIYADDILKARAEGRVCPTLPDKRLRTYAALDLGMSDSTSIVVFQVSGNTFSFIDYYENNGEQLEHYDKWLKDLPVLPELLIIPHDAGNRNLVSKHTPRSQLESFGWKTKQLTRTTDLWIDVRELQNIFDRSVFDSNKMNHALNKLEAYRKKFNKSLDCYSDEPLHDYTSHCADAFRYVAQANLVGCFKNQMVASNWNHRKPNVTIGRRKR